MQSIKKGDVIAVVVHYGVMNVVDTCIARDSVKPEDMTNPDALIDTSKLSGEFGWAVGPADLYLHEGDLGGLADGIPQKIVKRVEKKGYWWELRARVQIPNRTRAKNKTKEYHYAS